MIEFRRVSACAYAAVAALAALDASRVLPLTSLSSLPLCPFHALTGFNCPGCGMTRALVAAWQGRLGDSFALHPLALPLLALWTVSLVRPEKELLGPRKAWAALAVVLGVWLARLPMW